MKKYFRPEDRKILIYINNQSTFISLSRDRLKRDKRCSNTIIISQTIPGRKTIGTFLYNMFKGTAACIMHYYNFQR